MFHKKTVATVFGILAIITWGAGTSLILFLRHIPVYQMLFMSWMVAFFYFAIVITFKKKWPLMKQPLKIWLVGIFGIGLSQLGVVVALSISPAAQVHILSTMWPILIALELIIQKKQRFRYLIGVVVGFFAIFVLLRPEMQSAGLTPIIVTGYVIAFLSNFPWVIYLIVLQKNKELPSEMIGLYSVFAALLVLPIHFVYEPWIWPTTFEWMILLIRGIFASGVAYVWWQQGIQFGNNALLNILYYFNPVVALSMLILFRFCLPEPAFFQAGLLLVLALALCASDKKNN